MRIKKDPNLQRGASIRSIAICSSTVNVFHPYEEIVEQYLDNFLHLPYPLDEKSMESLRIILNNVLQSLNNKVRKMPLRTVFINPLSMNFVNLQNIESNVQTKSQYFSFGASLADASLIRFINIFQERTMLIHNSILSGNRILFNSNELSCQEICETVICCFHLVAPLNIIQKLFPFEHLSNIKFLETESFIAGVSNPLFKSRKNWWDLCCNIEDGSVINNFVGKVTKNGTEEMGETKFH